MGNMDEENLRRNMEKKPLKGEWMRTGRVPYPKHVWSPAGGWYAQPVNWKQNTAIFGAVMAGIVFVVWNISANIEQRPRMPEPGRFYPSRYWSKQIIEHEKQLAASKES